MERSFGAGLKAICPDAQPVEIAASSGRIANMLNGRRGISAETAVRLGRYLGNRTQFRLDLQASTASAWSSASAARRSLAGSARPTRPK
jgi:plasmid maintenance system antidote protein VapI